MKNKKNLRPQVGSLIKFHDDRLYDEFDEQKRMNEVLPGIYLIVEIKWIKPIRGRYEDTFFELELTLDRFPFRGEYNKNDSFYSSVKHFDVISGGR